MLEYLNFIDIKLFHFVNGSLSNSVFDFLMPIITDLNKLRLVLVFVAVILLWMLIRGRRHVKIAALLLIVTIVVSDQLSSSVLKYWLERPRPCHVLHNVHLLVSCGSGFSFPSSHAVNNFAAALILAFFFPRAQWWFFGIASLVAFSRVYVGVHYPSDIIGGAIIGLFCAGSVLLVFIALEKLWYSVRHNKAYEESF
ncbi:MAG: phosphatase PAP2 family protein [Ignavibacteriales bacterium]|nr:phosphatase PAP2 family protein [Ignavibacteriales bacterium]